MEPAAKSEQSGGTSKDEKPVEDKSAEPSKDNALHPDDPFIGVSPEYANYANPADAPLMSEDEETAKVEKEFAESQEALRDQSENIAMTGYRGTDPLSRFDKDEKKKG